MDAYFCCLAAHEKYMQRCLQLAIQGAGQVAPNPMVGALLVYNNRIIGEGYHKKWGEAHAEVNCLHSVTEADRSHIAESALYVSLEPCAHFGKTPPCADLIIQNKIREVIIGCPDSYAEVAGKGIDRLKNAGVKVTAGILENECREINKRFFTFDEKQRPYIILKWAQSCDGKIAANGEERTYISNAYTNRLVHKWRSEEAAILVGTNTALQDNPALTTRLWPGKDPVRLVIDIELKLPGHLKLFDGHVKTIVFNRYKQEAADRLSYYKIDEGKALIPQILNALYILQLQSVMVEGGANLLQSFIDGNAWDEARVITNTNMKIGQGINAPALQHHKPVKEENIQTDRIAYFINNKA